MGLTSKAFSDIITFSRASNATRIGPDGKVAYAPHNLLLRSQEFDNASWGTSFGTCTVTANAAAAPDGTVTADQLAFATAADRYQAATVTSGQTYTFSVWLRVASGTASIRIGVSSPGFSTVTVTTTWQRFTSTFVAGSTTIYPSIDSTSANTVLAWGAQVSAGSIAGDYTATTSAAVYGPRFDYDPVTLAAKGLLIEEQRTNLATYSEAFDNAAWTKANATISANSTTAPDGTVTADTLLDNTSAAAHYLSAGFTLTTAAYTFSVYVKSAGATWIALEVYDGGAKLSYFNVVTGVTGSNASGNTSTITAVGNGWYRCTLTRTFASTTNDAAVYLASADGTFNYTGTGTSGVYLWGAQLEAGAFATSYIPTVASTVTRSADVVSVSATSPWFNAVEGTLYAEAAPLIANTGASRGIFGLSGGTSSNSISLYINSSGSVSGGYIANGGAAQADFTPNYSNKTALAYKANDVNMGAGGAVGTTDTSATIPTISQVQLGDIYGGTSFKLNGWLRRIAYYPRRLTNAELQALTA